MTGNDWIEAQYRGIAGASGGMGGASPAHHGAAQGDTGVAVQDIAHVGSTAVPAIMAKPIIDIAVAAENFQDILAHQEALKAEGFFYRPNAQTSICDQLLLACGSYYQGTGETQTHFIHVVLQDSQAWEDYIRFRDYLNGHPEAARAYETLKLSLAREAPVDPGREKYLEGKRAFIQDILERARREAPGPEPV